MRSEYNPANWMLEMTTPAVEERIGQDFSVIYKNSMQFRDVEALIQQTSTPQPGSEPLQSSSTYFQTSLSQFRIRLWKQNLVYWRSPEYNAVRLIFTTMCALVVGFVFWDVGSKRNNTMNLMVVVGSLYTATLFLGGLVEIPYIATQTIVYGKFFLYLVLMFFNFHVLYLLRYGGYWSYTNLTNGCSCFTKYLDGGYGFTMYVQSHGP